MAGEMVQQALTAFEVDDHREAVVINNYFDSPEAANGDDRLAYAIGKAEEEFSNHVLGADHMGYQTARDAHRYWNMRNAVLNDALFELTYDPEAQSGNSMTEASLRHEIGEQYEVGGYLSNRVPLYFGAYATLERLRRLRDQPAETAGQLLGHERAYAWSLLMNVIDHRLRDPEAMAYDPHANSLGQQETWLSGPLKYGRATLDCLVIRQFYRGETSYWLQLFEPHASSVLYADSSDRVPVESYHIVEEPRDNDVRVNADPLPSLPRTPTDAGAALRLAEALAINYDYNLERPGAFERKTSALRDLAMLSNFAAAKRTEQAQAKLKAS